ncbi:helix-turn-helix transcriptional regulator [Kribbella sp. NPDC049584]|uniref:helix-turn-helix transcriptional regulator n=1 Tax=Kribbella sp. NPDC049584 TaxID=3154833 RepID=UPI00341536CB
MQGFPDGPEIGVVAGFLLKLLRGSLGLTQVELAEELAVDDSTIQGWESGRRPLCALRGSELLRLGRAVAALGAPVSAVSMLPLAVEADELLATCINAGGAPMSTRDNPLGHAVHRRDFVAFATWPFTGVVPSAVRDLPLPKSRGPAADKPQLTAVQRQSFFDQMLVSAEAADERTQLIRRQATYMLGFDTRPSSAIWLADQHRRIAVRALDIRDVPGGIATRSASLALARQGDVEPVRHFIQGTLSESNQLLGALTYWAYWLGEIPETYPNDETMLTSGSPLWSGRRLIEHLMSHLTDAKNAEMNIHSLLGLVMARRDLLESNSALRERIFEVVDRADTPALSRHARTELANLRFAAQLAGR